MDFEMNMLTSDLVKFRHALEYERLVSDPVYRARCLAHAKIVKAQTFFLKKLEGYDIKEDRRQDLPDVFAVIERDYWCRACLHGENVAFVILQSVRAKDNKHLADVVYKRWHKTRVRDILEGKHDVPLTPVTAARTIQRNWKLVNANPEYRVCRTRLIKEFDRLEA